MSVTVQHAEVAAPWADGFTILQGQRARDLMQVAKVMRRPGGKQLGERDHAEDRMASAALEIVPCQIECLQLREANGAQLCELGEQLGQRERVVQMGFALEGGECLRLARSENDPDSWKPVRALAVDEVGEHLRDRPGAFALADMGQRVGQITKQSVKRGGGCSKQSKC